MGAGVYVAGARVYVRSYWYELESMLQEQGSQHVEIMSRGNHERSPYLAYFLRCTRTIELS